ncbi:MAG: MarR family transcriptional regulator [Calditrichaeota bacterium]|nr:MAG: MarR family transcriptional regulator [Calditrichota bacterium]
MSLKDEIKQTKEFSSKSEELLIGLLFTADRIKKAMEDDFKEFGLTQQQYNILRILRGSKGTGLPTMEIANRMINKAPNVTRIVDRLIDKGFVCREDSLTDRRQVVVCISETGLKALGELDEPINKRNKEILNDLNQNEINELINNLENVRLSINNYQINKKAK